MNAKVTVFVTAGICLWACGHFISMVPRGAAIACWIAAAVCMAGALYLHVRDQS